jgi:hypothetical protein
VATIKSAATSDDAVATDVSFRGHSGGKGSSSGDDGAVTDGGEVVNVNAVNISTNNTIVPNSGPATDLDFTNYFLRRV